MTTTIDLLSDGRGGTAPTPLFVHAHPDDETLQTGGLIAWLTGRQINCDLVTCTRGERGEIVPGVMPSSITTADLIRVRGRELAGALHILGISGHFWLGMPPARRAGYSPRQYRDSGMRWVAEGQAGPIETADPDTFTSADPDEAYADLLALVQAVEPSVLVGYDRGGSYGHPDHLRAHELTRRVARQAGVGLVEVASRPEDPGFTWFDFPEQRATVIAALRCHATQLTVRDDHLVHVGGQRQALPLRIGLRRVELDRA